MRNLLFLALCLAIGQLNAQQAPNFPVDFDAEYFRRSPFSRWMRDPFKNPPGFAKAKMDKQTWPKLSSIVIRDEVPVFAVLDDKKYREGQFIDDSRYISIIGQNYVIITEGTFDYELVLADPKRNIAGSAEDER